MAGLIGEDYSGLAGLGGAVEGFAKGMMQAEDMIDRREERKFKRMEWEAQQKAKEIDRERRDAWEKEERDYRERKLELDRQQNEERMAMMRMMAGAKPTPGQKKVDEEFAKDYADFSVGGGRANVEKNLGLLKSAAEDLDAPGRVSGGVTGYLPEVAQDVLNPKLAETRDKIRSAIQQSLRQVLGAQYTEKEGTQIFNRAFNPRLSDKENARRVRAELDALALMAKDKERAAAYYEKNGTLQGFQPVTSRADGGLLGENPGLLNRGLIEPQGSSMTIEQKRKRLEELERKARGG